jgi:hypothetical protein
MMTTLKRILFLSAEIQSLLSWLLLFRSVAHIQAAGSCFFSADPTANKGSSKDEQTQYGCERRERCRTGSSPTFEDNRGDWTIFLDKGLIINLFIMNG